MNDDTRINNQLAAFTDQLLAGQETAEASAEVHDLAEVVRRIRTVIPPNSAVDPAYRAQLAQHLQMEWNLQYKPKGSRWQNRRVLQLMAAGIAVAVLLLVLLAQGNEGEGEVQGTALGPLPWVLVAALGAAGVAALIVWY
ncbi:MAG: hypothetical protein HY866_14180, partial [Chloroflexi bacterium]|nr:hypothetical protein [Chloroflexota bacterium]